MYALFNYLVLLIWGNKHVCEVVSNNNESIASLLYSINYPVMVLI